MRGKASDCAFAIAAGGLLLEANLRANIRLSQLSVRWTRAPNLVSRGNSNDQRVRYKRLQDVGCWRHGLLSKRPVDTVIYCPLSRKIWCASSPCMFTKIPDSRCQSKMIHAKFAASLRSRAEWKTMAPCLTSSKQFAFKGIVGISADHDTNHQARG